ncbi:Receptor-like kinase TMK2 [Cardamine amara subsp. amara]|uniref:Receptor-like kinase TMK2 n=1 Tax=Cardamine amara subsp. amara TaxID=228776 RepID=A0ABD1AV49_CARAN
MTTYTNVVCVLVVWLCFGVPVNSRMTPSTSFDPRVHTLLSIADDFGYSMELATSWTGNDPCEWFGVNCQEGNITNIAFISMNLTGTISPRFADLTSLTVIDLSHNRLTGTIPFELTKLVNLRILDVSYNQLNGKVPPFREVFVSVQGNPNIEMNPILVPSRPRNIERSNVEGLLIGIAAGLLLVGGGSFSFYIVRKMKKSKRLTVADPQQSCDVEEVETKMIPFQVLKDATTDFDESNIVGRGGFGSVYKGKLHNGLQIAVKRMEPSDIAGKGLDEFKAEVSVLTKVHHRSLVILHGFCIERNERLLVYQFMQQGTLARHLFLWRDQGLKPLEWTTRLNIALDVAHGLEYLHTLARQSQSYIHRDLKPSNILLGDDMQAKISDFGLVRSTAEGSSSFRTKFVGTLGYVAPEYALTGRVTTKVDVYSFGIILMELVTDKRAIDQTRDDDDVHVATLFKKVFTDAKVIDETIELNEETRGSIDHIAKLAGQCCAKKPQQRPDMSHVVVVISSLIEPWRPEEDGDREDKIIPDLVKRWHEKELAGNSSGISEL